MKWHKHDERIAVLEAQLANALAAVNAGSKQKRESAKQKRESASIIDDGLRQKLADSQNWAKLMFLYRQVQFGRYNYLGFDFAANGTPLFDCQSCSDQHTLAELELWPEDAEYDDDDSEWWCVKSLLLCASCFEFEQWAHFDALASDEPDAATRRFYKDEARKAWRRIQQRERRAAARAERRAA